MDEERKDTPRERLAQLGCPDPREVVEVYRGGVPQEVVETYVSDVPLPGQKPLSAFQPGSRKSSGKARARRKRRRRRRAGLWIALGGLILLMLGIAVTLLVQDLRRPAGDPPDIPGYEDYDSGSGKVSIETYPTGEDVTLDIAAGHGQALSAQEIYQRVNPSVVTVLVQLDGSAAVGTGVIFTADGYILTNFHVVEDGSSCTVALASAKTYDAKYVAGDKDNDIAVLKVDAQTPLPAAEIGDSDALAVGDAVYAIGNPLGVELRGTFTDGIVSAINRNVQVDGRTMTLIQTNAALNSGNSGGPLINVYGQVVGINTIKMSSAYSSIEGLGFALPTSSIARMVNELIAYGEIQPEPELGITVQMRTEPLPDGSWGLTVHAVNPGSGAEQAGIRAGDVIVAAEGEAVFTSADLLRIRRPLSAGDTMTLRIWRDGSYQDITVTLGEKGK